MFIYSRAKLRGSISAAAVLLSLAGGQAAHAEDAAAAAETSAAEASGDGLDTIVVTAQKRTENLQDTPIAISVVSSAALQDRHVTSILDLGDGAIPSLKIAPFFSRPGALIVNIRGVGVLSDSNQPARDQGVGVYVDGVYLGRAQGLGTALFDVESIEVLKGPQGTLFGRNTEGGAVSIVTRKPSGEFRLNATAGAGNYGSYKGEVHADLPEFSNISLKVDAVIAHRNGFVKNPLAGQLDYNGYDKRGIAVTARWQPAPGLDVIGSFDAAYDATSTNYFQLLEAPVGLPATATAPAIAPNRLAAIVQVQPTRASEAPFGTPQQASIGQTHGARLAVEYEASPHLTIKSITSYRWMDQGQFDNGNAVPSVSLAATTSNPTASFLLPTPFQFARYSLANFDQDQFSQELQAIGEAGRVKFVFGGLYYRENVSDNAVAVNTLQMTDAAGSAFTVLPINLPTVPLQRASQVTTTSVGLFGQATWTPPIGNDILHITAGARWTRDKKEGRLLIVNGVAPTVQINGVVGPVPPLDASWSRVDPMVNVMLDITKDIHVYGKFSTGYRSGGANSRSLAYAKFDPETISMFEAGAKMEFWDHRARLNLAGYFGDYKKIQLDFSGLYEDVINGVRVATTRTTSDTVNAPGTGKLKGFEAEFTLAPVAGLMLSASYAYNSVKIPDTLNPFPQTGGVFITVPIPIYQVYTPAHTASGSIDYEVPMKGFTLKAHIDGNYDSGYYIGNTDVEYDPVTRAVRLAQPKGDSGFVVNARLAIEDIEVGNSGAKLTLAAWARNLFNEQHVFYRSLSARAGVSGFFNDARTFGFDINVKM